MHLLSIRAAAALSLVIFGSTAAADERPKIVQRVGPIAMDGSHDASSLRRLLGDGCYVEEEGHSGGRYYTNTKRTVTFHTEFGVDSQLEGIDLQAGFHVPDECRNSNTLAAKPLDGAITIQHGIHLGMRASALIGILGSPFSDKTSNGARVLTFQTTYETDDRVGLFYDAYYAFKGGRLVLVAIHDGE